MAIRPRGNKGRNMKKLYIKDPIRGKRFIGTLKKGSKGLIFRKDVDSTKHLLRVAGNSYGIQRSIFNRYLRGKKGVIQIKELDTGKFLVASIKTWTEHSHSGNYGAGRQILLSRRFMHNSKDFDRTEVLEEGTYKNWLSSRKRLRDEFRQIVGAR